MNVSGLRSLHRPPPDLFENWSKRCSHQKPSFVCVKSANMMWFGKSACGRPTFGSLPGFSRAGSWHTAHAAWTASSEFFTDISEASSHPATSNRIQLISNRITHQKQTAQMQRQPTGRRWGKSHDIEKTIWPKGPEQKPWLKMMKTTKKQFVPIR